MAPTYATFFRCCCEVCDRVSVLVYTHWGDSGVPSELSESSQQAHQPLSPLMSYLARSGVFSVLTPHSPAGNVLIPDSTTSSKGLPLSGQNSTVPPSPVRQHCHKYYQRHEWRKVTKEKKWFLMVWHLAGRSGTEQVRGNLTRAHCAHAFNVRMNPTVAHK